MFSLFAGEGVLGLGLRLCFGGRFFCLGPSRLGQTRLPVSGPPQRQTFPDFTGVRRAKEPSKLSAFVFVGGSGLNTPANLTCVDFGCSGHRACQRAKCGRFQGWSAMRLRDPRVGPYSLVFRAKKGIRFIPRLLLGLGPLTCKTARWQHGPLRTPPVWG